MSTTLYQKYRPQTFASVNGQQHIIRTLTNALKHNHLGHAYLFTGPRGTGKTTTARLLAKAANCSNRDGAEPCLKCEHCVAMAENRSLDVIEIDAASNTGVDNIRELKDSIRLLPTQAPYKIYIIDEVHMLSIGAFNALLKTLEEPPKHVIFILATTSIHKVPETILSRCQRFDFSRIPLESIIQKLESIAKSEKVKIEPQAIEMIALSAEGGMRDAESLLMQVIALEDKNITADEVSSILGITSQQNIEQLLEHITNKDIEQSITLINHVADNGSDLYIFANSLLHTLRQMLLISVSPTLSKTLLSELTKEQSKKLTSFTSHLPTGQIITLIELFQSARKEIRSVSIPQLPLEIAVVKFLSEDSHTTPSDDNEPKQNKQIDTPSETHAKKTVSVTKKPVEGTLKKQSPQAAKEEIKIDETQETQTSNISIDTVRDQWKSIIEKVREQNPGLALNMLNSQPISVENSTVILGSKFALYKEKLNTAENRLTIESAFDTILKSKVAIQAVIDGNITTDTTPAPAPTDNPLLAQAMDILGGKIIA